MSAPVMLAALSVRDLPDAHTVKVVRERDLEGFDVRRVRSITRPARTDYAIHNKTAWPSSDGWQYARTLADVRKIIKGAP